MRIENRFYINNIIVDLEWKMIYVGSAESEEFDQVLDTIYVGPIPEGRHMFVFQVNIIFKCCVCIIIILSIN